MVTIIIWLIFLVTAAWVVVDAKALDAKGKLRPAMGDSTPWVWFVSVLILWIVFFPLYLYRRQKNLSSTTEDAAINPDHGNSAESVKPSPAKKYLVYGGVAVVVAAIGAWAINLALAGNDVATVQNGRMPQICPNLTIGELLNSTMHSPEWRSKSLSDKRALVQVEGKIGDGVNVLTIQFLVKENSFRLAKFALNGIDTNEYVATVDMMALCATAMDKLSEKKVSQKQSPLGGQNVPSSTSPTPSSEAKSASVAASSPLGQQKMEKQPTPEAVARPNSNDAAASEKVQKLIHDAKTAYSQKRFDRAIAFMDAALAIDPANKEVQALRQKIADGQSKAVRSMSIE